MIRHHQQILLLFVVCLAITCIMPWIEFFTVMGMVCSGELINVYGSGFLIDTWLRILMK
jgi:hypothetical protein